MTKTTIQYVNTIHKNLWEESSDGEISEEEIENTIIKEAGYTVKEKYWDALQRFDRIEQVPDTDIWIVKKPEEAGVNADTESDKRHKQVAVPGDVLEAAEQYGVNFSAVMTEALIEEVSNRENFIRDYLGGEYSEEEAEYIFEMLKNDLYSKRGNQRQMARRERRRRKIYRNKVGEDVDEEHMEKLRKKAFKLHELLEV